MDAVSDPLIDRDCEVWRLISSSGLPAGNIVFPRNFAPWTTTGDRVLGALCDSLGVATVQVYTLTPPQRLR